MQTSPNRIGQQVAPGPVDPQFPDFSTAGEVDNRSDSDDCASMSSQATNWNELNQQIVDCRRCPRLIAHCQQVAAHKRRAFADWEYWGGPVANFGDPRARLLIVGLAPAAHGANRTGRMFTGDRSGDWLFRALSRANFANQPQSTHAQDGLVLTDCAITAACHCAPPANKPQRDELEHCRDWLLQTIAALDVNVFLALGQIGWKALFDTLRCQNRHSGPRPKFAHGAAFELQSGQWVLGSYHPSPQNTFTGRLTESMLDDVFRRARELIV